MSMTFTCFFSVAENIEIDKFAFDSVCLKCNGFILSDSTSVFTWKFEENILIEASFHLVNNTSPKIVNANETKYVFSLSDAKLCIPRLQTVDSGKYRCFERDENGTSTVFADHMLHVYGELSSLTVVHPSRNVSSLSTLP